MTASMFRDDARELPAWTYKRPASLPPDPQSVTASQFQFRGMIACPLCDLVFGLDVYTLGKAYAVAAEHIKTHDPEAVPA